VGIGRVDALRDEADNKRVLQDGSR
jgi:hypothetical protein